MSGLNQKIILFSSFVLLMTAGLQAQGYKLRYKFENGKTYKYELKMEQEITQTAMGQEMKFSNSGSVYSKFVTENTQPAGNMSVLVSIDSGSIRSHNPMKDTTVNLSQFADKRTRMVVSPEGKIVKSEIVDTVKQGLETMGFSSRSMMQLAKLPVQDVKAGESWKVNDIDSLDMMGGKIVNTMENTYTLLGTEKKLQHDCLKISFSTDTKTNGKAKIMGMEFFIEGTGKSTGTVYFDPKAGIMVHTESDTNSEMTMATTGQQNMIIPINQATKVSQSLLAK